MKPILTPAQERVFKDKTLYLSYKEAYYNGKSKISDAEFDKLEDRIRKSDPKWKELGKTGVRIKQKKVEVELPQPMPSLDKKYPEALPKWLAKYGSIQVAMDKLDGSALYLGFVKGKPTQLITRGDGELGGDISFLIPFLGIPDLKKPVTVAMRCEAVMPHRVFASKWASEFENPRNTVNGILNRALDGKPHAAIKDIHIVVLGVFGQELEKGLRVAKANGLKTVPYAILKGEGTAHYEQRLKLRREHGDYEVDGLVLAPPEFKFGYTNADKPKGTVAFKVNEDSDALTVVVKKVIWQVSSLGRFTPKVMIDPIRLGGVTVTHATAHNAKWMADRGIGPGAKIKILRSGGVIPKIVGVVKAGKFQAPDQDYKIKGVHFVAHNADDETKERITVLKIKKFIKTMGIEFADDGIITQTMENLPSVRSWVTAWSLRKLGVKLTSAGVGGKMAKKIVADFDRVLGQPVPAKKVLVALSVFDAGIGERKLQALMDGGMALNYMIEDASADEITTIKGFSEKTAELLLTGAAKFKKVEHHYSNMIRIDWSMPKKAKVVKNGKLSGQVVSFTGYRSPAEEEAIIKAGGQVANFSKKTTILLYNPENPSGKLDKAKAQGAKVCVFSKLGI